METTNTVELEQGLIHKSFNIRAGCADFISNGWKFIKENSLEVIQDYPFAIFRRMLDPQPEVVFFKIFDPTVLDLFVVSNFINYLIY